MLSPLSSRQRIYFFLSVLTAVVIVGGGYFMTVKDARGPLPDLNISMSIRQIAPKLNVTPKSLTRELGLPLNIRKNPPLSTQGISEKQLTAVASHLWQHQGGELKYFVYAALVLFALVYLTLLGRPDGSTAADRSSWYPRWPYWMCLSLAVVVCGFALGKSPNPMEGAVKLFKSMAGLYPSVLAKVVLFAFFVFLSMIGTKLICGWACPFGALQELIYELPILKKLKRKKVPFFLSNSIRLILFIAMLLILFGVIGHREGMVIYHFVNPFNLFNLELETLSVVAIVVGTLIASLGLYRPFCRFICPFGLISWVFERFSLFGVRIDPDKCVDCGACSRACPSQAAAGRVKKKILPEDCFSCARCLNTCPTDAIHYERVGKKHPPITASEDA